MNETLLKDKHRRLVEDNIKLVHYTIQRYFKEHIQFWEYEEMFQWGCFGLCKASTLWDKSKGKFSTYATTSIKRMIERYKIRHDWGRWQVPDNPLLKPSDVDSINRIISQNSKKGKEQEYFIIEKCTSYEEAEERLIIKGFTDKFDNLIDRVIFQSFFSDYNNKMITEAFEGRDISFSIESVAQRKREQKKAFRHYLNTGEYVLNSLKIVLTKEDNEGNIKMVRGKEIKKYNIKSIHNSITENKQYCNCKWYYGDIRRLRKARKKRG